MIRADFRVHCNRRHGVQQLESTFRVVTLSDCRHWRSFSISCVSRPIFMRIDARRKWHLQAWCRCGCAVRDLCISYRAESWVRT